MRTINTGFELRSGSDSGVAKTALTPEVDALGGGSCEGGHGFEAVRLVEVDDVPPKPEKASLAGLDSSGNRSPVRVIFERHMRWSEGLRLESDDSDGLSGSRCSKV